MASTMTHRTRRALALVLTAVVVMLFAYFVYPTPYAYYETGSLEVFLIRVNRYTGEATLLLIGEGWVSVETLEPISSEPPVDP